MVESHLGDYDTTAARTKNKRLNSCTDVNSRGTKSDHEARCFSVADSTVAGNLCSSGQCSSGQLLSSGETHNNQHWKCKYSEYGLMFYIYPLDSTLLSDEVCENFNRCNFKKKLQNINQFAVIIRIMRKCIQCFLICCCHLKVFWSIYYSNTKQKVTLEL